MKYFNWNPQKNEILKKERGISFEVVTWWIENSGLIDILEHPNKKKYPSQNIYVVNIDGYVYLVPFVENTDEIFLKTIIPSRKDPQKYIGGNK